MLAKLRKILYIDVYKWDLENGNEGPIWCRAGIEVQMQRMDLWTQGEKGDGMN